MCHAVSHQTQNLCLVVVAQLSEVDRFVHFYVLVVQTLPLITFDAFVDGLADGVPILVYQRRSPFFSSSQRSLLRMFTNRSFWEVRAELGPHHRERFRGLLPVANLYRLMLSTENLLGSSVIF